MKKLEPAIRELVKSVAPTFPTRAPQNQVAPFIIYQRVDGARWRSINGPSKMAQVSMQIDVYANTYTQAKELANSVETILDGYRGTVYYGGSGEFTKIAGVSLQNEVDIFDETEPPFLFRNSATYLVTYDQE